MNRRGIAKRYCIYQSMGMPRAAVPMATMIPSIDICMINFLACARNAVSLSDAALIKFGRLAVSAMALPIRLDRRGSRLAV